MQVTDHPSVTMLEQLGGNRFIAMTGAKNFVSADNPQPRLTFRLPTNLTKQRGSHFEISLLPSDTYRLVYFKLRNGKGLIIARHECMVSELRSTFTEMTGLDTHL